MQRNSRSMYITTMIFNLSKFFFMNFAKNIFPKHESQDKMHQLAIQQILGRKSW